MLRTTLIFFTIAILLILEHPAVHAQGCSDAGFCTMGAMRPNQPFARKINFKLRSVELSSYFGLTQFYLKIFSITADANIGITKTTTAQVKLPYQYVDGFLANTQGMGDISISATQMLITRENFQVSISLGGKIPTGDANLKAEGRALPSYYQTTLGTWDVVGGISLITKNWLFATGYQQALTQNKNEFLWGPWNRTSDSVVAAHYPKSRYLKRGNDVMFRVEKNFRFTNWNTYIGLLVVHRLNPDTFLDVDRKRKEIVGSDGTAATILFGAGYRFNTRSAIKIMGGLNAKTLWNDKAIRRISEQNGRFIERNPDGLSRKLVVTIGYEYRF